MLARPVPMSASCRSGGSPGEPLPLWATGGCKRSRQAGQIQPLIFTRPPGLVGASLWVGLRVPSWPSV